MKLNVIATPLMALVALAAAGSAFAEGPISEDTRPFVSTKTRAEVLAEVQQARADGTLRAQFVENYAGYGALPARNAVPAALPTLPRLAATPKASGASHAELYMGEDSGSFELSRQLRARIAPPAYSTAE